VAGIRVPVLAGGIVYWAHITEGLQAAWLHVVRRWRGRRWWW